MAEGVSRQRHDLKGADPVAWLNQAGDLQVVSFIHRVFHIDAVCEEETRLDAGDKQLLAPGGVDLGVFRRGGEVIRVEMRQEDNWRVAYLGDDYSRPLRRLARIDDVSPGD